MGRGPLAVPEGLFVDMHEDEELALEAVLEDGRPLPAWLEFDRATGRFSGRPSAGDVGVLSIALRATDSFGAGTQTVFSLEVRGNAAPVLSAPLADAAGKAGEDFSYVLAADAFSDPDGDALSYSASLADGSALPSWLSFDAASRTFSGRPDGAGTWEVNVVASDGLLSAADIFRLSVPASGAGAAGMGAEPGGSPAADDGAVLTGTAADGDPGSGVFPLAEAAEPLKGLQRLGDSGPEGVRLCLDSPEAEGPGDAQKDPLHLSGSVFTALSEAGPPADSLFVANATGSALDDRDCILYHTTAGALRHGLDAANAGAAIQLSGADDWEKPWVSELFAVC